MDLCRVCGSASVEVFVEIRQVPVHCNILWPTKEEALSAPRGDLRLGFCADCGHVFNTAFDPGLMEYTQAYENSLHFSPRFQAYAEALATRLIEQYGLRRKDVIDIGCGKGDFLALLCSLGENTGVGFDPSYVPEQMKKPGTERMTIVRDFYSSQYAGYKADLITCRHVLEHIPVPREFLLNVRTAIGNRPDTVVFFEVPNVLYTLRDMGIWDLIYEHCSYFSSPSLERLFGLSGFDVCGQSELYEGQFLGIDALPARPGTSGILTARADLRELKAYVSAFAEKYREKVVLWRQKFAHATAGGEKVIVWGGGSKGVTFLNTLETAAVVQHMVDINPRKQGMYVGGTGQQIVAPEFLLDYRPDMVVVMNPVYVGEIREHLDAMGIAAAVAVA